MRRVVVTGLGIISCIGNNQDEVAASLKAGKSGITKDDKMVELGFRSQISGRPADTTDRAKEAIGKRSLRFMPCMTLLPMQACLKSKFQMTAQAL